jgi:HD-GYP domain-containing protein (c-di-GMP phosphodiesterase class II)
MKSWNKKGKTRPQVQSDEIEHVENQRSHLLYFSLVLLLILGISVVVYAASLEVLDGLFGSDYFNNVIRFSFALLLVATVVYLITKEKSYARSFNTAVSELETNVEDLKGSLEEVSLRLELSRMVVTSDDLHEKLEKRFPGRKNHWKRVSYYAAETARRMELDDDYVRLVEKAGELMDIGMLSFPETFRSDAAELSPREKEMIRRHPLYSEEALASIRPNWEVLPLVRHHHEWWNGSGYPDGLKGETIPLGSRILQLADAFVAMTSNRAYKGAREAREALAEIEACANMQFDPRVVQAFLSFMAPRVFLDVDGMPVETEDGKEKVISLMSLNDKAAQLAKSHDSGKGNMDIVEVENLLRDISEQSA